MEQTLIEVADELAQELSDVDQRIVIRALCDCLRADPGADPTATRRAARHRLMTL
ncbi:MAG: hypothetical protein ACTHOK_09075 [Nocardioidaceae bacterium]